MSIFNRFIISILLCDAIAIIAGFEGHHVISLVMSALAIVIWLFMGEFIYFDDDDLK